MNIYREDAIERYWKFVYKHRNKITVGVVIENERRMRVGPITVRNITNMIDELEQFVKDNLLYDSAW